MIVTNSEMKDYSLFSATYETLSTYMNDKETDKIPEEKIKDYISGISRAWAETKYKEHVWRSNMKKKYNLHTLKFDILNDGTIKEYL